MSVNREYPAMPVIGIGGIVIEKGRVLLVRRGAPPLQGEWAVPGGRLELGEKISEGVRRELAEETNVEVKVKELVDVFESITLDQAGVPQYHFVVLDYLCEVIRGEAKAGSDATEVIWVPESDLPKYSIRDATMVVIQKAFQSSRNASA